MAARRVVLPKAGLYAILVLGLFFVLGAGRASAATYYVVKNVHATNHVRYSISSMADATASGTPTADIEQVLTIGGVGTEVVLQAGTYSGTELDSADGVDSTAINQTLRGETAGAVVLDGAGGTDHTLLITHAGFIAKYLNFINAPSGKSSVYLAPGGGNAATVQGCIFSNSTNTYLTMDNGIESVIDNQFVGGGGYKILTQGNSSNVTFARNIVRAGANSSAAQILFQNNGIFNAYNNIFSGCTVQCLVSGGAHLTGVVNIQDNIFLPTNSLTTNYHIALNAGITGALDYNFFGITPGNPGVTISASGLSIGMHNVYSAAPKINKGMRHGYVAFGVDDFSASPYDTWAYIYGTNGTDGIAAEFESRGVPFTWYIDSARARADSSIATKLQWARAHGIEIGLHSRTHSDLTFSGKIFDVTKGAETITINRALGTITLSGGGVVNNFRNKTLATVKSELEVLGATIMPVAGYNSGGVGGIYGTVKAESIADITAGNAINVFVGDSTQGYLKTEIFDALDEMESVSGVGVGTIHSFSYPLGTHNAAVESALQTGRGGQLSSARGVNIDGNSSQDISNLNRYNIACFNATDVKTNSTAGDSTADIVANTNGLLAWLADGGRYVQMYAHQASEISKEQWATILDEVKKWNGLVTYNINVEQTMLEIMSFTTDDGDGTLSYTWTDQPNYSLKFNSALIDAGTTTSSTTDFAGNKIYGTPDIGGYEYQPPHTIGTDKIDIGAGGRIYGDGKFRDVGTINSNLADLKITPSGGTFSETTSPIPAFLDVSNITNWTNAHKTWTESNAESAGLVTDHTVGDLDNNKNYNITVSGIDATTAIIGINGTTCNTVSGSRICKSDGTGKINFRYTGGYSIHTFDVVEGNNTAPTITINNPNTTPAQTKTLTASTSDGTLNMSNTVGTVCDSSLTFIAYTEQTFSSESDNSTKVCYQSVDANSNTAYSLSNAIAGIDTTPPTLTDNDSSNGTLSANTTQANLSFTTNEDSTCKFSTISNSDFATMTQFTTTGSSMHTTASTNLTNGTDYQYFVKCQDAALNFSDEATVTFNVANPVVTTSSSSHDKKSKSKPKPKPRALHQSTNSLKNGQIVIRTGKHFSKLSKVAVYFSKRNGTYYNPMIMTTTKQGTFSLARKIQKVVPGRYSWYAVDQKTGRKSKVVKYTVR